MQGAGNLLASVLAGSALLKIFAGHRVQVQGSAHNIIQKDWELWTRAMWSVPNIVNRRIRDIARIKADKIIANDEREFWRAVADGCG